MRKYLVPQYNTLNYMLGDHLGSTSITVDATTNEVVETRYKPWGDVRYTTQNLTLPTRYTFTGQYSHMSDEATDLGNAGFGLLYFNARWMDPQLGRFAQADSIIPGGAQGYDRYAYTSNNPVRYTDPTGHKECDYDCQVEYEKADPEFEYYCYWCEWDVEEQEKNEEVAETILFDGMELLVSILFEPADWALTIEDCLEGNCSLLALALMVTPGLNGKLDDLLGKLPLQDHHILANINKKWTGTFSDIAKEYGLGLGGSWNIINIPHLGRHSTSYHTWVFEKVLDIDNIAKGDTDIFLELFATNISQAIIDNPLIVRGIGIP